MTTSQYALYCRKMGLRQAIDVNGGRAGRGIGGNRKYVGKVLLQVPFKCLGVVIDIYFMLLEGKVPTIMCLKDLYRNGMDISVLRRKIICVKRENI